MVPGKGLPLTLAASETGSYAPLMLFDCRGFEPTGYIFRDGWKAESVSRLFYLPFFEMLFLLAVGPVK